LLGDVVAADDHDDLMIKSAGLAAVLGACLMVTNCGTLKKDRAERDPTPSGHSCHGGLALYGNVTLTVSPVRTQTP
jgi:hypothetical protein